MVLSQGDIQRKIKSIVDEMTDLQHSIECDDQDFQSLAQIRKELIDLWVNVNRTR